ncbi:unnamed protein product [Prunus armeniaca]|uniref:Reverse transcriptase Ty1/copia-type domain-containing protein n=1 Tax=Prunus armeniaca TaxID=36596 RepID=A0A6J5WDT5_PRUAR|nr:unnamed protein product [Prunus armeniaca]
MAGCGLPSISHFHWTRHLLVFHHIVQFMSAPCSPHLGAANHILCYLKSTIWFGLSFRQSPSPFALCGFSDFDWAGYLDTCRSTIGFCTTWISHLLHELELPSSGPTILLCDNLSTTYMASNPVFHARTKHIELDYHFIIDRSISDSHQVQFVSFFD